MRGGVDGAAVGDVGHAENEVGLMSVGFPRWGGLGCRAGVGSMPVLRSQEARFHGSPLTSRDHRASLGDCLTQGAYGRTIQGLPSATGTRWNAHPRPPQGAVDPRTLG